MTPAHGASKVQSTKPGPSSWGVRLGDGAAARSQPRGCRRGEGSAGSLLLSPGWEFLLSSLPKLQHCLMTSTRLVLVHTGAQLSPTFKLQVINKAGQII